MYVVHISGVQRSRYKSERQMESLSEKDRTIVLKIYHRLARLGADLIEKEKAQLELGGATGQDAEKDTGNVSTAF